jgi:hypothetical protein
MKKVAVLVPLPLLDLEKQIQVALMLENIILLIRDKRG